jgi:hypothetical protein
MATRDLPAWIVSLDGAELELIKRFVLASGSLKEIAREYGVSYPTIRLRLDRVIERVERFDAGEDAFEAKVRSMVAAETIDPRIAKELLDLHRRQRSKS